MVRRSVLPCHSHCIVGLAMYIYTHRMWCSQCMHPKSKWPPQIFPPDRCTHLFYCWFLRKCQNNRCNCELQSHKCTVQNLLKFQFLKIFQNCWSEIVTSSRHGPGQNEKVCLYIDRSIWIQLWPGGWIVVAMLTIDFLGIVDWRRVPWYE